MTRAVLIALIAVLAAAVSPVAAAKPCWQQLIDDYADGRIDGTYPVHCYSEALARLPEDVRVYSSAEDDFQRALLASTAARKPEPVRTPAAAAPTVAKRSAAPVRRERARPAPAHVRTPDLERGGFAVSAVRKADPASNLPLPVLVSAIAGTVLASAGALSALRQRGLRIRRRG